MIALVKDVMIFIVLFVCIIYIPIKLGGFGTIFAAAHQKAVQNPKTFHEFLPAGQLLPYASLALGSALALFLYPHSITGTLSSSSREVVKRNAALLPIYTLMLGMLALLGYMALAVHVQLPAAYKTNGAVPALITAVFPSWFAGFCFAAISIGALVPASIMSIAAANLFTRNIYREYLRPNYSEREEASVAKITSLLVKFGALLFILFVPATQIINFQLLGGVWIIQTLPAVFLGLYTNWFHRWALIIGWAAGMLTGTVMAVSQNFSSVFPLPLSIGGVTVSLYAAVAALLVNLVLVVILTPVLRAAGIAPGRDATSARDYEETGLEPVQDVVSALDSAAPPR
jgi:SSS family solute:Na+ symporter